jgi:hypothetical protein
VLLSSTTLQLTDLLLMGGKLVKNHLSLQFKGLEIIKILAQKIQK